MICHLPGSSLADNSLSQKTVGTRLETELVSWRSFWNVLFQKKKNIPPPYQVFNGAPTITPLKNIPVWFHSFLTRFGFQGPLPLGMFSVPPYEFFLELSSKIGQLNSQVCTNSTSGHASTGPYNAINST